MIAKIVGIKRIDFSNDKGEKISGTRLYLQYEEDGTNGTACDKKFFDDNTDVKLPKEFVLNRDYEFVYTVANFSGKAKLVEVKLATV